MTAADRPTIDVEPAVGGWPAPWPAVAELATVLPKERWTLVGGLMVQLHTAHRGWGIVRRTGDVDIVLHIETTRARHGAGATPAGGFAAVVRTTPRRGQESRPRRRRDALDTMARSGRREA